MTLAELYTKIEQLKIIKTNAVGVQLIDLATLIDELNTKYVALETQDLIIIENIITAEDIVDFDAIATAFEDGTTKIEEVNRLIDNAIVIGRKLLGV